MNLCLSASHRRFPAAKSRYDRPVQERIKRHLLAQPSSSSSSSSASSSSQASTSALSPTDRALRFVNLARRLLNPSLPSTSVSGAASEGGLQRVDELLELLLLLSPSGSTGGSSTSSLRPAEPFFGLSSASDPRLERAPLLTEPSRPSVGLPIRASRSSDRRGPPASAADKGKSRAVSKAKLLEEWNASIGASQHHPSGFEPRSSRADDLHLRSPTPFDRNRQEAPAGRRASPRVALPPSGHLGRPHLVRDSASCPAQPISAPAASLPIRRASHRGEPASVLGQLRGRRPDRRDRGGRPAHLSRVDRGWDRLGPRSRPAPRAWRDRLARPQRRDLCARGAGCSEHRRRRRRYGARKRPRAAGRPRRTGALHKPVYH